MHSKRLLLLLPFLATCLAQAAQESPDDYRRIEKQILGNVQRMRAATVSVRVGTVKASGAIIEDGFVITAAHAVKKTGLPAIVYLSDGSRREAVVHGIDRSIDVALLKLNNAEELEPAVLAPRDLTTLEFVIAIGNPFGFDSTRPALVRIGKGAGSDVIQSQCRIARGDSGGPLFDLQGRLIGVHRQILKANDANFHTGATAIVRSLDKLRAGKTIDAKLKPANLHKLPQRRRWNDTVTPAVEVLCDNKLVCHGTIIDGPNALIVTKASELGDDRIEVRYNRDFKTIPANVVAINHSLDLALLKAAQPLRGAPSFQSPELQVGRILVSTPSKNAVSVVGATSRAIPHQRGELGLQLDDNLTITAIQPNSAAKKAGLQTGDVLVELDENRLQSTADVGRLLGKMEAGDRFPLVVLRSKTTVRVLVQLRHPASQRFEDATFLRGAGGLSSVRRTGFKSVVQHDADITPRDCGGPVMTLDGKLAGINIARAGREAVFMIPAADVQRFVKANTPTD